MRGLESLLPGPVANCTSSDELRIMQRLKSQPRGMYTAADAVLMARSLVVSRIYFSSIVEDFSSVLIDTLQSKGWDAERHYLWDAQDPHADFERKVRTRVRKLNRFHPLELREFWRFRYPGGDIDTVEAYLNLEDEFLLRMVRHTRPKQALATTAVNRILELDPQLEPLLSFIPGNGKIQQQIIKSNQVKRQDPITPVVLQQGNFIVSREVPQHLSEVVQTSKNEPKTVDDRITHQGNEPNGILDSAFNASATPAAARKQKSRRNVKFNQSQSAGHEMTSTKTEERVDDRSVTYGHTQTIHKITGEADTTEVKASIMDSGVINADKTHEKPKNRQQLARADSIPDNDVVKSKKRPQNFPQSHIPTVKSRRTQFYKVQVPHYDAPVSPPSPPQPKKKSFMYCIIS